MTSATDTKTPFYGWWVLAGLVVVYATTNGILTHTLPLLNPYLMTEFGWSAATVTGPAVLYYFVTAVTSPFAGYLLDRFSAVKMIGVGLLGIIVFLFLFSRITSVSDMTLVYIGLGTSLSLCGLVSNMVILTRWFNRFRGRATGILLMASSAGGAMFPLIVGFLIAQVGWRSALLLLGIIVGVLTVFPLFKLLKNRPEDVGQSADGVAQSDSATRQSPEGPSLLQAMTHMQFYLVAIATACTWFGLLAMIQHQPIYLEKEVGIDASYLKWILSTFAFCSVVGKLLFGYLSDRLEPRWVMLLSVLTLAASFQVLNLLQADNIPLVFVYAVFAGIAFSGAFTMSQVLIAKLYAGLSYGKILGVFIMIDTLTGATGIRIVGTLKTSSGSYDSSILLVTAVCGISVMAVLLLIAMNVNRKKPVAPSYG